MLQKLNQQLSQLCMAESFRVQSGQYVLYYDASSQWCMYYYCLTSCKLQLMKTTWIIVIHDASNYPLWLKWPDLLLLVGLNFWKLYIFQIFQYFLSIFTYWTYKIILFSGNWENLRKHFIRENLDCGKMENLGNSKLGHTIGRKFLWFWSPSVSEISAKNCKTSYSFSKKSGHINYDYVIHFKYNMNHKWFIFPANNNAIYNTFRQSGINIVFTNVNLHWK